MNEDQQTALVADTPVTTESEVSSLPLDADVRSVPICDIDVEAQPWKRAFDEKTAEELTKSISSEGLLHAITVRLSNGKYQLVAGRHRVAAAKQLGWDTIPAVVVDADDQQTLMICLDENLRRKTLSGAEKTEAIAKLRQAFEAKHGKTSKRGGRPKKAKTTTPRRSFKKEAAAKFGKSERTVQRIEARDRKAIPEVKEALVAERISEAQVDELMKLDPKGQKVVLAQCEGKTRDETRVLVVSHSDGGSPSPAGDPVPVGPPPDSAPCNLTPSPASSPTSEVQRLTADFISLVDAVSKLLAGGGAALDAAGVADLEAVMERALDLLKQLRDRRQGDGATAPPMMTGDRATGPEGRKPRNMKPQIQDV